MELTKLERLELALKYSISEEHKKLLIKKIEKLKSGQTKIFIEEKQGKYDGCKYCECYECIFECKDCNVCNEGIDAPGYCKKCRDSHENKQLKFKI